MDNAKFVHRPERANRGWPSPREIPLHRPPVSAGPLKSAATRRIKASSLLVFCGVLLAAVVLLGAVGMLASLRHDALNDIDRELKTTALILADQTDRAFQSVDLIQSSLIDRLSAPALRPPKTTSG